MTAWTVLAALAVFFGAGYWLVPLLMGLMIRMTKWP